MMGEDKKEDEYFRFEGLDLEACDALGGELDEKGRCAVKKERIFELMNGSGD